MAKLAKVYNDAGGGDKGEAEVKKAKKQLKLLMKLGSIDEAAAMKMIKKTAASQRALPLLSKLASVLNIDGEAVVKESDDFNSLMESYDIDEKAAMNMVKKTATSQQDNGERFTLTSNLAKVYNLHDSKDGCREAVRKDERFARLTELVGSEDTAMASVEKLAESTNYELYFLALFETAETV